MDIDITKSSFVNFVNLVNHSNPGLELEVATVEYDNVTSFVGDINRNTRVRIKAQEGKGLSGSKIVSYYRPGLLEQVASPSVEYEFVSTATANEILQEIASELGLLSSELAWITIPTAVVGSTTTAELAAKNTSLLYQGSILFSFTWLPAD